MNSNEEGHLPDSVAIVGLACRFPRSPDANTYWSNLRDGVECITHYTEEDLRKAGIDDTAMRHPNYVKANPEIDGFDQFDASFFGLSPTVAQITDPQQRIFLECAWQALESAGYDSHRYQGDIGVFAGLSINTYLLQTYATNRKIIDSIGEFQTAIANRGDHLATLTCYKLNLKGPGITTQSTCSTSLTSVHLAAQCLLDYQTDMAIAGGVSVRVPHRSGYLYQEGGVASPDGHCRPFDAKANGTVFGSGSGAVVLKRLEDAIADNDNILAVIRGSAINNDGSQKIGYTAPSIDGQQRAIRLALANANVNPETIDYIETHGTGTPLGDPVEIEALTKAFRSKTQKNGYCAIGSVKSNIGHLDTASGIAGLIKTILSLSNKQIPPSLHFDSPNPKINFDSTPFFVSSTLRDWPKKNHPRRAGVSSFGIGGTNVHMVLEEAPQRQERNNASVWQILPVSAKTPLALEAQTTQIKDFLEQNPLADVADVAYTLQTGRREFEYRRIVVCSNASDQTVKELKALSQHRAYTAYQDPEKRPVAFIFSSMGSHELDMAVDLYQNVAEFRTQLHACIQAIDETDELRIKEVLLAPVGTYSADQYASPELIEPAMFAMEYALAKTWIKWGIKPQSVMGDGIGEYVAAAIAGVLTLAEIKLLLLARRECLQQLPAGSMLVVHQSQDKLQQLIANHTGVEFAGLHRESRCVVSGGQALIDGFAAKLDQKDIVYQRLKISCALNCSGIDAISEKVIQVSNTLIHRQPEIPMISSVTGTVIGIETLNDRYWSRQMCQPKHISDAIDCLLEHEQQILLEIGPGSMLMNIGRLHPSRTTKHTILGSLFRPDSECSESRALMTTLGRLWLAGQAVMWERLHEGENPGRIALPTYPFERKRYWIDPPSKESENVPVLEREQNPAHWFYTPSWKQSTLPAVRGQTLGQETQRGQLLLFADIGGLTVSLLEQLKKSQWNVTQVVLAEDIKSVSPSTVVIKSRNFEDYENLFATLARQHAIPDKIVYTWPLTSRSNQQTNLQIKESVFFEDFWSLVSLVKALAKHSHNKKIQLLIVVNGLHRVFGNEKIDPLKSSLLGPARVIPQEYPNISCQCIDVVMPRPGDSDEIVVADQLLTEINTSTTETFIAYRGRHRWSQSYSPIELKIPQSQTMGLREQGVYLITGGLGGLGLTLAKHLAIQVKAKLVLLSRSAPTDDGNNIFDINHSELTKTPELQKNLREIIRLGGEIFIARADVGVVTSVELAVDAAIEHFGTLNGVIHAAGTPGQNVIQLMDQENARSVFMSKVRGTMVLDDVLARRGRGDDLDFLLLCGSRTAVLGGIGQADYVSANAFLDSFSEYKQESGVDVFSIDWCGLKDVGMLANTATKQSAGMAEAIKSGESKVVHIGHPLLHRQIYSSTNRKIYETDFAVDTHWVLSDHQISGDPVIPGTTYLEMVRAAFDDQLDRFDLEISEVYFLTPLRVKEGEQRTTTLRLDWENDAYRFLVESCETGEAKSNSSAQKHVVGRVKTVDKSDSSMIDIDTIINRCAQGLEIFTDEDAVIDDHGPRWQNVKKVYHGDNEMFTLMELADEFAADLGSYRIHPSLLDKSIGTGRGFDLGDVPLIPYSYKQLRYKRPFTQSIYVYTQSHGVESNHSETPAFDVTITDKQGNILVQIDTFCLKRVNDVSEMYKSLAKSHHVESKLSPELSDPISPLSKEQIYKKLMEEEGISPQEVCDIFDRMIAHSGISQFIVSTKNLPKLLERGMIHTRSSTEKKHQKTKAPVLAVPEVMHPRPKLPVSFQSPESGTQQKIATIWQNILGIEEIGIDDNFFDLGGDSVVAIQISSTLNQEFDIDVPVVQLFDAPTIRTLSKFFSTVERAPTDTEANVRESRGSRRRNKVMQKKLGI